MKPIKTLTISNDPALRKFIMDYLNSSEFDLSVTEYYEDEIEGVVSRTAPELILLDVQMPGMSGIATCLHIRQFSQTPILMLSVWGAGKNKIRGMSFASESRLSEPFDAAGLFSRIKSIKELSDRCKCSRTAA